MTHMHELGEHLDSAAAAPLAGELLAFRGGPLNLSGSAVAFAGTLVLQVLVAARKQWRLDGHDFKLEPASEALQAACTALGVPLSEIGVDGADNSHEEQTE